MYKRNKQGPGLGWRRKRDRSVTARDAADWNWVYLVFTKDGRHDFLLMLCAVCNAFFWVFAEELGGMGILAAILLYGTPIFTCYMAAYNWLFYNGWMRARAIIWRPADQYSWWQCWGDWEFLLALALCHIIGFQVLAVGLYGVDIMYGRMIGGTMIHDWIMAYLNLLGYV